MDGYSFVSSGDGSGYYVDPNGNIVTAADYQALQQQQQQQQQQAALQQQYGASAWTQGYAPATGQPYQINDYTGTPTINVDANGNVTAWRGASGQIWTPASYNKAVATGQVAEPSNANPVDIAPLQNIQTQGILQSALQGALFVAGAALMSPEFAGLTSALSGETVTSGLATAINSFAGSLGSSLGLVGQDAVNAGNALIQAANSGAAGALSNKNPLISALSAGISPFVGSTASDLLQGAGVSSDVAKILGSTVSNAAKNFGGSVASGQTGAQQAQAAELGAIEGGVSSGFQTAATEATTPDWVTQLMEQDIAPTDTNLAIQQAQDAQNLTKGLTSAESLAQQYLINPELAKLLGIDVTTSETEAPATGAPGQTRAPTTTTQISSSGTGGTRGTSGGAGGGSSVTFGGVTEYGPGGVNTTGSPSTQALASALNVGSPSSATSDVPDPSTGGQQQNVWNQASLRVKDDTGSY